MTAFLRPSAQRLAPLYCVSAPTVRRVWDASALSAFIQCPTRYFKQTHQGWGIESDGMIAGTIYGDSTDVFDKALGQYLNAGLPDRMARDRALADALHAAIRACYKRPSGPWASRDPAFTPYTIARAVTAYADTMTSGEVRPYVRADGTPALEIVGAFDLPLETPDGDHYILMARFDGLAATDGNNGLVYAKEKKLTKSALGGWFADRFDPNPQISTQALLAHATFGGEPELAGVMIEACQTGVGFCRFQRFFAQRTVERSLEWLDTVIATIAYAEECALADRWPMHESNCMMYAGCDLRTFCNTTPSLRENVLTAPWRERGPWNPIDPDERKVK